MVALLDGVVDVTDTQALIDDSEHAASTAGTSSNKRAGARSSLKLARLRLPSRTEVRSIFGSGGMCERPMALTSRRSPPSPARACCFIVHRRVPGTSFGANSAVGCRPMSSSCHVSCAARGKLQPCHEHRARSERIISSKHSCATLGRPSTWMVTMDSPRRHHAWLGRR